MPLFTVFVKGTLSSLIPLNEVGSKKNAWLPRRSEWIALTCTRSLTFLSSKAVWLHIWLSGYHMGFLSVLTQVCTMHSLCAVCTGQSTSTKIMPYYSPFNSSRSRLVLVLLSFFLTSFIFVTSPFAANAHDRHSFRCYFQPAQWIYGYEGFCW